MCINGFLSITFTSYFFETWAVGIVIIFPIRKNGPSKGWGNKVRVEQAPTTLRECNKNPGCLGYRGVDILPKYVEIIINPIIIMISIPGKNRQPPLKKQRTH